MTTLNLYKQAVAFATEKTKDIEDTRYGCGSSFVTIKWDKFCRELKKEGLAKKDCYYGWIVEAASPFNGTLETESYKEAFAEFLSNNGVHAFVHTRLN